MHNLLKPKPNGKISASRVPLQSNQCTDEANLTLRSLDLTLIPLTDSEHSNPNS